MNCKLLIGTLVAALLVSGAPTVAAASPAAAARTVAPPGYATPVDAAQALAEAVRAEDVKALVGVLGSASRSWLSSGDPVIDRRDWERFLAAYDRKHTISEVSDGHAILLVGDDGWPFPAPLVRNGERWRFDSAAGKDEILNRRIGRNELDTIQTLLAIVDAQREYAAGDLDGNGSYDYARRFISSTGQRDGLYWAVAEGELPSPLGPLVGAAAREGYAARTPGSEPAAYHGYRYRILTAQGKDARGGAYDYLVGDRLLGGFAVLAYPARYGVSGVMSFIVSHDGIIYQKNLGPASDTVARRMTRFNPDASWLKLD